MNKFLKNLKKNLKANTEKDDCQVEFLQIFGVETNKDLLDYLAEIDTSTNVCAKKLGKSKKGLI
jgi:hypothetical protein